jgi:hypothetical protein
MRADNRWNTSWIAASTDGVVCTDACPAVRADGFSLDM